jgi:hypothetical protein
LQSRAGSPGPFSVIDKKLMQAPCRTEAYPPQQLPPCSLLALFMPGAISMPGFWSKNPTGISLKPVLMQG